jgi:isocitrate dehydrogenase
MLSIVKLMNGGGLFETGAGGSAPKHVQQLHAENHLRWDSSASSAPGRKLQVPRREQGQRQGAASWARRSRRPRRASRQRPLSRRKAGQPDNRDSHYWFARYWAEALAAQTEDADLAAHFAPIAKALAEKEAQITAELMADRGKPVDRAGTTTPIRARPRRSCGPRPR